MLDTLDQSIEIKQIPLRDLSCPRENRLLHFWEIQDNFKCPVVGMCLTHAEQQQLLK